MLWKREPQIVLGGTARRDQPAEERGRIARLARTHLLVGQVVEAFLRHTRAPARP